MSEHGGKRKGAGRPPLPREQRRSKHEVWLHDEQAQTARRLGGGNLSSGVRKALNMAKEQTDGNSAGIRRALENAQEQTDGNSE